MGNYQDQDQKLGVSVHPPHSSSMARAIELVKHALPLAVQVAILLCAFAYVVWQNSFLSSDWWLLPLRDIDDMAMNGSTEQMRDAIRSGTWGLVASFFDYAYGAGFYLLMTILTLPAYLLESTQAQILIGRNSSLLAVFLTSLVVALIGRRLFPESKELWLVAVGVGFLTPISLIDATKMHVNGWTTLLGAVSILFVVYQTRLSRTFLYLGAIAMGAAIGFKLTALGLLPVFIAVIIARRGDTSVRSSIGALALIPFSAVLFGAPIIFFYPIHPQGAETVFADLLWASGAASGADVEPVANLWQGLGFYGSPILIAVLLALTVVLGARSTAWKGVSMRKFLPIAVAITFGAVWGTAALVIDKTSIYLATYTLSISVFLPIGVYGLGLISSRMWVRLLIGWFLVATNFFLSPQFSEIVDGSQNYAKKSSSLAIERKLRAAQDIAVLLRNEPPDVWVLLDSSSVFPRSSIDGSALVSMNYGSLASRFNSYDTSPDFDYVVIDSESYYGQPNAVEEGMRDNLQISGRLGSSIYKLVYSDHGTELYRHERP